MADSQQTQNPAHHPHAPIVKALADLGYEPAGALWEAASRMARAPEVVWIMLNYVKAGKPSINFTTKIPNDLFIELPGGYSVASLIRDFGFATVGAFLMASELVADTHEAEEMLTTMIEEGYFMITSTGVRAFVFPPISKQYPSCPNCGCYWVRKYTECPRCKYGVIEQQIDNGQIPDNIISDFLDELKTHSPPQMPPQPGVCHNCKKALELNAKFCMECGAPVKKAAPPALPPQPIPKVCSTCNAKLAPDAKFCSGCGAQLSQRKCPMCQATIEDKEAGFCSTCGYNLRQSA